MYKIFLGRAKGNQKLTTILTTKTGVKQGESGAKGDIFQKAKQAKALANR